MHIATCGTEDIPQWVTLRCALWPDEDKTVMAQEAPAILADPDRVVLVAKNGAALAGFAESSLRRDYVNGCATSPVAFVEGLYVVPERRRHGVARALIAAIESWARRRGLRELASDALLDNNASHAMHEALGFTETERVVYFRKALT